MILAFDTFSFFLFIGLAIVPFCIFLFFVFWLVWTQDEKSMTDDTKDCRIEIFIDIKEKEITEESQSSE